MSRHQHFILFFIRVNEIPSGLTQLGLDIDRELAYGHLRDLAARAHAANSYLWIDMEQSHYVDVTLALTKRLREEFPRVGVCLQAYLRRTVGDVEALLPTGIAIRFVKGAYREDPALLVGGKREILQKIAPLGPVYQAGTLSGNPVAVAAGLATLKLVEAAGFQEKVEQTARSLVEGLVREAKAAGVAFSAQCVGSMFGLYFRAAPPTSFAEVMQCDKERFNRFFHAMLARGIYLAPSAYEAGFVGAAHGEAEIRETLTAAEATFAELAAG